MNIAIITLDALRWDATQLANTPYINKLAALDGQKWHKVYAQGNYTLPAHVSVFQAGILPGDRLSKEPIYNREIECPFRVQLSFTRGLKSTYPTPPADSIVQGFTKLGFRTVGIGGVAWFNTNHGASTTCWKTYFKEFYWEQKFQEGYPDAFEQQIKLMETLNLRNEKKLYFFLNIPTTHTPCRGDATLKGQSKALEYIDSHFEKVINMLPKPVHVFLFADHGTCWGDDGVFGHTFYHPKISEVPMVHFKVK